MVLASVVEGEFTDNKLHYPLIERKNNENNGNHNGCGMRCIGDGLHY